MEYAPAEMGVTSKYTIKLPFCTANKTLFFVISGFRREVDEICALSGVLHGN